MLKKGGGGVAGEKVPAPTGTFSPDRPPNNYFKHTFLFLF
jgi:hypothetical protein